MSDFMPSSAGPFSAGPSRAAPSGAVLPGAAHGSTVPAAPRAGLGADAEATAFIGRETELAELRAILPTTRALTLCGPGGIGKTRLAQRLATTHQPTANQPAQVRLVELADLRRDELVPYRVAEAAGVTEEPGRPILDTLIEALRPRRTLLVLDNCEHLINACARFCQQILAGCPSLRIIATSREPLRVAAEKIWQVPPLTLPSADDLSPAEMLRSDAVRLFADRASAVRPGFTITADNRAAVAAICAALDGLPLAIELAAAQVGVLSAEQIATLLADRFRLPSADERTGPARHRTLRAAIDWSHDLLTAADSKYTPTCPCASRKPAGNSCGNRNATAL